MIAHQAISDSELRKKLRRKELTFGGNKKLKIYGTLHCLSGKRMKRENRVFFVSEEEAGAAGYRPCGHCMKKEYQHWKHTHMDLFNNTYETNLLPYDGEVIYYGIIFPLEQANRYASLLMDTIAWKNDEALIYGKRIVTARKVAWYADREFSYTYSGTTKQALPWTQELLELKKVAEEKSGHRFNSCLLNLYHHGEEGMAWHSDDESSLGKNTVIASMSFGAERKFAFKHKQTKDSVSLILGHGSLLVMKGATQSNWLHRLPPTTKVKRPRINLTFRTIIDQG